MEMDHGSQVLWSQWQAAPEIFLPMALLTFLYLQSAQVDRRQRVYFFAALASIIAVVNSPIGTRAHDYFTLHMAQHITLMMVTGPLLVMATPKNFSPQSAAFKLFTHPVLSWVLYALLMVGVHLPGPHNFIMQNPWAHTYIEVPLYIALPYLFYFNLLDRKLKDRRVSPALSVISLFLMMVPETLTGFFIYVSRGSLYDDMYTLNDQRTGGSFMWSGAMIIDTVWMGFAVYHWIKSEELKSAEVDAQIQAERSAKQ
jgi:putative copper resistance protein D